MRNPHSFTEEDRRIVARFFAPLQDFARLQSAGGILLLICTVVALVWANSPWSESYAHLLHAKIGLSIDKYILDRPLEFWINDWLMTIFFSSSVSRSNANCWSGNCALRAGRSCPSRRRSAAW